MRKDNIQDLFRKLIQKRISIADFIRLRKSIEEMDNPQLDEHLTTLWDEYIPESGKNQEAFENISHNLDQMLYPAKNISNFTLVFKRIAAVVIPLLIISNIYLFHRSKFAENIPVQNLEVRTEKGEKSTLLLPDGSKVYLNSQSTLSYPSSFSIRERIVSLQGEGYFEIASHDKHPFIVETEKASVHVTGTTFNVYSPEDSPLFETALVQGQVEIITHKIPAQKISLKPNQKASYNAVTDELYISETDLYMETAWIRNDVIFRAETIENILLRLENFYGVRFHVEGEYPKELFNGSYHETDVTQVLINLQQLYEFGFRKVGNDIYITFTN